jgi:hypothetical protein
MQKTKGSRCFSNATSGKRSLCCMGDLSRAALGMPAPRACQRTDFRNLAASSATIGLIHASSASMGRFRTLCFVVAVNKLAPVEPF